MFKIVMTVATAFSLLFGGATTSSQPGDPLYAMKEWSVQAWNQVQVHQPTDSVVEAQQIRDQDQTCDPAVDPACIPVQDQIRDQKRDQLHDQTCDPALDLTCEPLQEQLREQDRTHQAETEPLHENPQNPWTDETPVPNSGYGPGDSTCDSTSVPTTEPGPNGNGNNGNKP
ncbi:MAG TPA: hypothetical protein PK078_14860 [Anaerolineales bacterium]|nr:hypothetical protein [Anaerolineales bacterium]